MSDQRDIRMLLREELERWEILVASLSEEQVTTLRLRNGWTVKDVLAHLMAWQQVSIARLAAASMNEEPMMPEWLQGSSPESEGELDTFNARIYQTHKDQPWSQVHLAWQEGSHRFLQLAERIPENELVEKDRYPWLNGYALHAVLQGSYEHHRVHFEALRALRGQGD